jgi:hypothetical protein
MIFFVTAYDDATRANFNIIAPLLPAGHIVLSQTNATKKNILQAFSNNEDALFAMSHGESTFLYDNEDEQAICSEEAILLSNRICYVYACYTANYLGRAAARCNAIYWGYTGAVHAPDESPETIGLFQSIFNYIMTEFNSAKDLNSIERVLSGIKEKCDEADSELDDLGAGVDSYTATRHIWARLRVNINGHDEQVTHVEADKNDLFETGRVL